MQITAVAVLKDAFSNEKGKTYKYTPLTNKEFN